MVDERSGLFERALYKSLQTDSTVQLTVGFILITTLFFSLLVHIAVKRWNKIEATLQEESP